jgi:uncharacterized protein
MRLGRRAVLATIAVTLLVVLVGGRAIMSLIADLLWYRSLDLESVFWTRWWAALMVRGLVGVVVAAIVFLNLWIVTRSLGAIRLRRRYGNIEIAERLPQGYVFSAIGLISVLSGWWLSAGLADPLPVLAALNPERWGLTDPVFNRDAAFYVFQLPLLNRLQTLGAIVVFWIALLAGGAYLVTGAIKLGEGRPSFGSLPRRHLGMLLASFLLLFAINVWLDRYGLVVSGNGFGGAIGYTDVNARLPGKAIVFALTLATAAAVAYGSWVSNFRLPALLGALLVVGMVGAEAVYPTSLQRFVVDPNQFPREQPFIEQNLAFTRAAFGLRDIERVPLPYDGRAQLDESVLVERLSGVPLWDPRPLLTTFRQQQGLFRYFTFASVHQGRYTMGDRIEPVAISVRELETSELETAAQTWQNLHLNYVAGEGAVVSPVSRMAVDGTPIFYVWDRDPPKLSPDAPPGLSLENPAIYFGERSRGYVILGPDRAPRGVALDGIGRKLLFAWAFQSPNILLSSEPGWDSRIVYRRQVAERVQSTAPFLHVPRERSANPIIHEGRVIWFVDAYTSTSSFPLSPMLNFDGRGVRYLRNSVKATVDAVTGEVALYAVDPNDPILRTYSRIFPGLIRDIESMPEALQRHLRYPVQMMLHQAQVLGAYHLVDPRLFYAQQDVWSVATEQYRGTPTSMEPNYVVFPLPGSDDPEFLLTLPFVARGRQNMTALLVTRNDPPNYGQQILYTFPRDEQIPGPQQIEAAIDQDPEISQQLALWRRGGADVIRGHLTVVPVDGTLLYVEPLFLEAENAAIPQLERVILGRAGRVVMRPSFESAVAALLGGQGEGQLRQEQPGAPRGIPGALDSEAITRARRQLEEAEALLRAGDWAGFGRSLQSLRETLGSPAGPP